MKITGKLPATFGTANLTTLNEAAEKHRINKKLINCQRHKLEKSVDYVRAAHIVSVIGPRRRSIAAAKVMQVLPSRAWWQ